MKFVSYIYNKQESYGLLDGQNIYDIKNTSVAKFPTTLLGFIEDSQALTTVKKVAVELMKNTIPLNSVKLLAPVPCPPSMRDGYAFRQHVETARRNRGLEMIPEFDQFPVFYFTNHQAVTGPGEVEVQKQHLEKLDFELEVAIVIGKKGKNISVSEADDHIFGYTIMNDWSARALQMEEMKLNLGPAKGKDFATSIGPFLVTRDELYKNNQLKKSSKGDVLDAGMKAFLNGKQYSEGNVNQMNWTFAQIIERASYGVTLYPGDVIGSGTVGTGCGLELGRRLKHGDVVELEIERIGVLRNRVLTAGEAKP